MKKVSMLVLLIFCIPILAMGAQVYGNLKWNNASVGENVPVKIHCPDADYEGRTDAYGSYTVPLRPSKNCGLYVYFNNTWSSRFDVYPYDDPVRYDFDLIANGSGLDLRRR